MLDPYDEDLPVAWLWEECYCSLSERDECQHCDGAGRYLNTFSPRARWDWWIEIDPTPHRSPWLEVASAQRVALESR